jgi:hypothetical protein
VYVYQERAGAHDLEELAGRPGPVAPTAPTEPAARAGANEVATMAAAAHQADDRGARDKTGGGNRGGLYSRTDGAG